LLEKLFTLRRHMPEACGDISIKFSQQNILPIIFPPEKDVKITVYDELLKRLQAELGEDGKKGLCQNYQ
jgi:hypothetical protein